jgi:CheY-like chemotaxis protein
MEIICQRCEGRFKIPDDRIPAGRQISIKCPKCQGKIEVQGGGAEGPGGGRKLEKVVHEVSATAYDAAEQPFDYLQAGMKVALLCEHSQEIRQRICPVLEGLNYHVVEAASAREALKFMRFHGYDLLVLNEIFEAVDVESNYVLQYLAQLPMDVRRDIFVVLLGSSVRTMDNMTAFNRSVNLVVNLQDVSDFENILKTALTEHEEFYRVFKDIMKAIR